MKLYHGTSQAAWAAIQDEGVEAPSYWGTLEQAQAFAQSHGEEGLVLEADMDEADLTASLLMAEAMLENGDIEVLPEENDLAYSLEYLGGVTCVERVFHAAPWVPADVTRTLPENAGNVPFYELPDTVWRGESSGQLFTEFDLAKTNAGVGFFFSESQEQAQRYAQKGTEARSFVLSAERVLDLTDPYRRSLQPFLVALTDEFEEWIDRHSGEPMSVHAFLEGGALYDYEGTGSGRRWNTLFQLAWDHGYDAVRVLDTTDGPGTSPVWVVRHPEQIKPKGQTPSAPQNAPRPPGRRPRRP